MSGPGRPRGSHSIEVLLYIQFNSCCRLEKTGCLKRARVIPLFKTVDSLDKKNYRPISSIGTLAKIFEKLMHSRLMNFLEKFNILSQNQYGFQKNTSTTDALLQYISEAPKSLDRKETLISVFLDFSKVFDTVNHTLLLQKLEHMRIRRTSLKWFELYLTNRTQVVCIDDINSTEKNILSGVPQGSVLGPALFICYVNCINNACSLVKSVQFADDTTLYLSHKNSQYLSDTLNRYLTILDSWLCANRLSLNIQKTSFMVIYNMELQRFPLKIRNCELSRVQKAKFLGVILDGKLNFKDHTNCIQTKKISRSTGAIYRIKDYLPIDILIKLYYAMIYPHMTYAVTVWGASNLTNRKLTMQSQRKFLKLIPMQLTAIYETYHLIKFGDIYKYFTCIKMYQSFTSPKLEVFKSHFQQLIPPYNHVTRTRLINVLNIPRMRLSKFKSSFLYNAIVHYQ